MEIHSTYQARIVLELCPRCFEPKHSTAVAPRQNGLISGIDFAHHRFGVRESDVSAEPPTTVVSEPREAERNSIFGELSLARIVIVLYIIGLLAALVIADASTDSQPNSSPARLDTQTDRL